MGLLEILDHRLCGAAQDEPLSHIHRSERGNPRNMFAKQTRFKKEIRKWLLIR
jgi:hypothetical protein